jgi:hypothetical protein
MKIGDEGCVRGSARSSADVIKRKAEAPKDQEPVLVIKVYPQPAMSRSIEIALAKEGAQECLRQFAGELKGQIFGDTLHPSEEPPLRATCEFFPTAPP